MDVYLLIRTLHNLVYLEDLRKKVVKRKTVHLPEPRPSTSSSELLSSSRPHFVYPWSAAAAALIASLPHTSDTTVVGESPKLLYETYSSRLSTTGVPSATSGPSYQQYFTFMKSFRSYYAPLEVIC